MVVSVWWCCGWCWLLALSILARQNSAGLHQVRKAQLPVTMIYPAFHTPLFSHHGFLDVAVSFPSFTSASSSTASSWIDNISSSSNTPLHFEDTRHALQRILFLDDGNLDLEFWEPVYLSTLAGLSTVIGASVAFFVVPQVPKNNNDDTVSVGPDLLSFSLALAGSVMITVCLVSIIPESLSVDIGDVPIDTESTRVYSGVWVVFGHILSSQVLLQRTAGFALGWGVYALLSRLLTFFPEEEEMGAMLSGGGETVQEVATLSSTAGMSLEYPTIALEAPMLSNPPNREVKTATKKSSWRLTILLFLSLMLHNFPEGLAVAASAASSETSETSSSLSTIVALSIALHNIPEGIAIAVPCLAARPNQPWLAFGLASLSGLAEPIGAFFALAVLRLRDEEYGLSNGNGMGDVISFVAGIMMAVAICELIPEASRQRKECDDSNSFALGTLVGISVMVLTELYLGA